MIKKNIKVISMFILGVVCALGITISAYSMNGKKVLVKVNGWNVKNVEEAISYLKNGKNCRVFAPPVATVKSGNVNTAGSIVQIGDEEFYVLGQETSGEVAKTKLVAKYALGANNNQSSTNPITSIFSSSNYWTGQAGPGLKYNQLDNSLGAGWYYVYDENSNIHTYIDAYVDKLESLGLTNISGRLPSAEEYYNNPSFMKLVDNCWVGVANINSDRQLLYCQSGSCFGTYSTNSYVIRPVILVPTSEIE